MKKAASALLGVLVVGTLLANAQTTPKSFSVVTIGKQVWMQRNLDVFTFRNGDSIPQAASDSAWMAAAENETPAWCYYNNDSGMVS